MNSGEHWDKLPFVPAVSDLSVFCPNTDDYLILCDGNSITRHGTSADIAERLGWKITAGMAASCEANDYVHLLAGKIQNALPEKKVKLIFTNMKDVSGIDPDLVIIQGGEHCLPGQIQEYEANYTGLIAGYKQRKNNPQIILISIWNPTCRQEYFECTGENYQENALAIREMQRNTAEKFGIEFADMSALENITENTGCGEVAAVRWHPSDSGMKAIADMVFDLWQKDVKK